ncbi:MAG: family 43 glycosylhydrolase [Bacteroidaceae bacterium]|nr:family 43 glycosylhydrolase [Bacteroidaceae bacterium]
MKKTMIPAVLALLMALTAKAQNPFVQTWFTSDPAPMVHNGRMYVYTGHDEDGADFFWMQEWRVYSTVDMVNWTDHGSPLALESFSWADDRAWAAQTVERDGKFYWYICAHSKISNGMAIGVAVSDSPTGPFKDAIGKPLFENGSWDHIDPTVLIDSLTPNPSPRERGTLGEGSKKVQAWIMWGNPQVYYAKLNDDMISIDGEVKKLDMTEEAFGSPAMNKREKGKKYKDSYVEGPWLRKVDSSKFKVPSSKAYQLLYAAGGVPEHISYSTAPHPTGPWTYAGEIMPLCDTKSFTNHCGVADYKGHSYFFYHTGKLPRGGGFGRSVAVEEFQYNPDGSFPTIMPTDEGVKPIAAFNPYQKVQAETMAFSRGVKTEQNDEIGVYVSDIHNGDYIKLQNVKFDGNTPKQFSARVASGLRGGQIEVHIDSLKGALLARLEVPGTGGWEKWQTLSADIENQMVNGQMANAQMVNGKWSNGQMANAQMVNGKWSNGQMANAQMVNGKWSNGKCHDLYLVFTGRKGPKLFNFDWWQIEGTQKSLVVEDGGTGNYKAIMKEEASLEAHTVFVPQDLSAFNEKNPLPVLVWGNGACTNSPWEHFKFLNEIASHGYLVLATGYIPMEEKPYQGPMSTTEQQIQSIDWAIAQNADPASPYYNKVDVKNICVAGMSCGGLQSLYNCADPRITSLMICNSGLFKNSNRNQAVGGMPMPDKSKLKEIHTPIIYILGGKEDIAYENDMDDFHLISHVPACAANFPVGHGGTYRQPHGGEFSVVALNWLNWQLKGDKQAAKMFKGKDCLLSKREGWTIEKNAKFSKLK